MINWLSQHLSAWSFYIAFGADCLAALIAIYFILSDYWRYPNNIHNRTLSLVTMAMIGWIVLCYLLFRSGHKSLASTLAWIPAFPLLGYGLLVALMVILKPDFK